MKMRLQQAFSTLVRAPTQRISKRNSTGNASWGGVPTQKLTKSQLTIMLAGPQHREIGFPISTDNASWGGTTIKKYFSIEISISYA